MIKESKYYSLVIKKHVNEELIFIKDDKNFGSSAKYWICDNTFVKCDIKVRDCYLMTGKYRGDAHTSYNVNVSINYKIATVLHNLKEL